MLSQNPRMPTYHDRSWLGSSLFLRSSHRCLFQEVSYYPDLARFINRRWNLRRYSSGMEIGNMLCGRSMVMTLIYEWRCKCFPMYNMPDTSL